MATQLFTREYLIYCKAQFISNIQTKMDGKKHQSSSMRERKNHLSFFASKVLNVLIQNYRNGMC